MREKERGREFIRQRGRDGCISIYRAREQERSRERYNKEDPAKLNYNLILINEI